MARHNRRQTPRVRAEREVIEAAKPIPDIISSLQRGYPATPEEVSALVRFEAAVEALDATERGE